MALWSTLTLALGSALNIRPPGPVYLCDHGMKEDAMRTVMRTVILMLPALALLVSGCGDEDCHTEIRGAGGKTFCMPDPAEEKWACIPLDAASAEESCDWLPSPECPAGMEMDIWPEGGVYAKACRCEVPEEKCDGSLRDARDLP